jgi:hypothetical protein
MVQGSKWEPLKVCEQTHEYPLIDRTLPVLLASKKDATQPNITNKSIKKLTFMKNLYFNDNVIISHWFENMQVLNKIVWK